MAAKAQACIDEEISRLSNTMSDLLTQKNTFALVSRLPPQILARIFVYYACDDYHNHHTPHIHYASGFMMSRWIGVSYVCRHWRHVALTCPALWSHLFMVSPWWTEALLVRSLDSPLRMCVEIYKTVKGDELDFMERVAMHVERLQECCLQFESTPSDVSRMLSMFSSRAAPLLRILKVTIRLRKPLNRSMGSGEHGQVQAVDDHILFNGDTPMLRELELTNFGMPWCSPTLEGLTTLRLCNLVASAQLTTAELKAVLRRMPDLVQLHLENALRSSPSGSRCQDSEKHRLPSLAHLFISAPMSEIVSILSYVDVPLQTQVRLGCHQKTPPSVDDFILFISLLSQRLGASTHTNTSLPIRAIAIEHCGERMHVVFSASEFECGYHTIEQTSVHGSSSKTPLIVNVNPLPPLAERSDDMMANLCQSVPLVHLTSITLHGCSFSSTFWVDTLWHLQELRSIKLIETGLSDLITTLSMPARPPPPNTKGPKGRQVFAPALENLELEDVGFTDSWHGGDPICKVTCLSRVLAKRKREAGRALGRLGLTECWYFYEEDVAKLADVVEFVDWDKGVYT